MIPHQQQLGPEPKQVSTMRCLLGPHQSLRATESADSLSALSLGVQLRARLALKERRPTRAFSESILSINESSRGLSNYLIG